MEWLVVAFLDTSMLDAYPMDQPPMFTPEPMVLKQQKTKFREWSDLDDAEQWHVINLLDDCGLLRCTTKRYMIDRITKTKEQIEIPVRCRR